MSATAAPMSAYLAERLRARREETKPRSRRRQTDVGPIRSSRERDDDDDDLFLAEAATPDSRKTSLTLTFDDSASVRTLDMQAGLGLREMNQRLEQLTKETFDLKLEVSRRREKEEKLMGQLEALSKELTGLHEIRLELKASCDRVLAEHEKANAALNEAVIYIDNLQQENSSLNKRLARLDSLPPQVSSDPTVTYVPPMIKHSRPQVSFADYAARDAVTSNIDSDALRSVVLETERNLRPVKSYLSMLSEREGPEPKSTRPPGTFSGLPAERQDGGALEDAAVLANADDGYGTSSPRQDSIKRVNRWFGDNMREDAVSPTRSQVAGNHNIDTMLSVSPDQLFHTASSMLRVPTQTVRSGLSLSPGQSTEASPTDPTEAKDWHRVGGSISKGTPSRFLADKSVADRSPMSAHVPSGFDTPRPRRQVPPDNPLSMRPGSNRGFTTAQTATDGYEIETYQPRGSREFSPNTAVSNLPRSPDRRPVAVEDSKHSSPDSSRHGQQTLAHKTRGLFRKRRMSELVMESPSSTHSSYLSEAASSTKHRPSTPNTSLSSRATTVSQDAVQSEQQSGFKKSGSSLAPSEPEQQLAHRSREMSMAPRTDDSIPTSTKPHRRRSAFPCTSSSRHGSPEKATLPGSNAPTDLSRHCARAAWEAPATLSRSSSTKAGGFIRALGFGERRMSKA